MWLAGKPVADHVVPYIVGTGGSALGGSNILYAGDGCYVALGFLYGSGESIVGCIDLGLRAVGIAQRIVGGIDGALQR